MLLTAIFIPVQLDPSQIDNFQNPARVIFRYLQSGERGIESQVQPLAKA